MPAPAAPFFERLIKRSVLNAEDLPVPPLGGGEQNMIDLTIYPENKMGPPEGSPNRWLLGRRSVLLRPFWPIRRVAATKSTTSSNHIYSTFIIYQLFSFIKREIVPKQGNPFCFCRVRQPRRAVGKSAWQRRAGSSRPTNAALFSQNVSRETLRPISPAFPAPPADR